MHVLLVFEVTLGSFVTSMLANALAQGSLIEARTQLFMALLFLTMGFHWFLFKLHHKK